MRLMIGFFLPKNLETNIHIRVANTTRAGQPLCDHDNKHEHEQDRKAGSAWPTPLSWIGRCYGRILGGFVSAGFLATLMPHRWWKGSVIPPKRTGSLSDDRECARRLDYGHALVRLF